jgi:site-specific DNA recombinase
VLQRLIASDDYSPHTFDEIREMVAPEVAARLNPSELYGVYWWGRQKVSVRTTSEPDGNGGRRYRKRKSTEWRPKEGWVAIPVPAYLPKTLVDRARTVLEGNMGNERKHLARSWELRGVLRCSCGRKMATHTTRYARKDRLYHYYQCHQRRSLGSMATCRQPVIKATALEDQVWELVLSLLQDPERIRAGMERLIEQEQANGRDPVEEPKVWAEKIPECARLRNAYQDQQASGLMTLEELGEKLKDLEDTRKAAEAELEALTAHKERLGELEKDRDALVASYAEMVPEALGELSGEVRNRIYRMMRLEVICSAQGYEVSGALCTNESTPWSPY